MSKRAWALALSAWCASSVAYAGPEDREAQTLFDAGVEDMQAGRYDSGCPKLERSYALEALPGVLFTMAACHERWGKTYTAQQQYQRFVDQVATLPADQARKHEERVKNAKAALESLRGKVPTLTVSVEGELGTATVELDGKPVAADELGKPRAIDPGDHVVVVKNAAGEQEEKVTLTPGDKRELSVKVPEVGKATSSSIPEPPSEESSPEPESTSGLRIAGFVVGGVGVAGLIVGAVTGGLVFAKKGDVEDNCKDLVCNAEGLKAVDDAETLGMVSNVAFAVGGAAVVAGVLMVLLGPDGKADSAAQRVTIGPGGLGLRLTY